MKKWSLALILTIVTLSVALFSPSVSAAEGASLNLTKSAGEASASLGDIVTYTFTISNTGNVTVDNVTLEDHMLWSSLQSVGELLPGDNVTMTENYTVTMNDFLSPSLENTATVMGKDLQGNIVTANASAPPVILNSYAASITVTKVADRHSACVGDNITYTITIDNTGEVGLVTNNITDTLRGDITGYFSGNLTAGASENWSYVYTVESGDPGQLWNTVEAYYYDELSNGVIASDNCSVNVIRPSIIITKKANKTEASLHDIIIYTYTVTNDGDTTVDNLTLEDDKLGVISLDNVTSLEPGDNVTVTENYTVTLDDLLSDSIVNTAITTGTDLLGNVVTAQDTETVFLVINKPAMTKAEILKLSGVPGKGIDNAPGLQKQFNLRSRAAEHAGKKK